MWQRDRDFSFDQEHQVSRSYIRRCTIPIRQFIAVSPELEEGKPQKGHSQQHQFDSLGSSGSGANFQGRRARHLSPPSWSYHVDQCEAAGHSLQKCFMHDCTPHRASLTRHVHTEFRVQAAAPFSINFSLNLMPRGWHMAQAARTWIRPSSRAAPR